MAKENNNVEDIKEEVDIKNDELVEETVEKEEPVAETKKVKKASVKSEKEKDKKPDVKKVIEDNEENVKEKYLQKKHISKSKKLKVLTKKERRDLGLVDKREARAILKYERISPRKVKIVGDLIKGKSVNDALTILKITSKAASPILEKVLKSAIANAENNNGLDPEQMFVLDVYANQGPTLKRMLPRAKGKADRIRKRTSHITVVVRERN